LAGDIFTTVIPAPGGFIMLLYNCLQQFVGQKNRAGRRRLPGRKPAAHPLLLEVLEGRLCPSGGYLFVPVSDQNELLRFDEFTGVPAPSPGNTGATFVPPNSNGLAQPDAVIVGPDGNLYSSSGFFSGFLAILRYDSTNGAPLPTPGNTGATFGDTATVFAQESSLTDNTSPLTIRTILFGLDGNLYVAAGYDGMHKKGWVDRFDGTTGAYLGKFVTDDLSQNGGLKNPQGMLFGPDGKGDGKLDLYVASSFEDSSNNDVKRYDGTTGQFLDEFVATGSGGLDHAAGITFGPDGNLYVASGGWGGNGGIFGLAAVLRYEGPTSPDKLPPGTFLSTFVPPGSGGLNSPFGLLFGPDGNGDGQQDLYVSTWLAHGTNFKAKGNTSAVLRYDGVTGSFIDAFVPFGSVGMDNPGYMAFTETDPTTLAFNARPSSTTGTAPVNLQIASVPNLVQITDGIGSNFVMTGRTAMDHVPDDGRAVGRLIQGAAWDHLPTRAPHSRVVDQVFADLQGSPFGVLEE
jgi:hypothetical protein